MKTRLCWIITGIVVVLIPGKDRLCGDLQLEIGRSGDNVRLTWSHPGAVLEQSSTLTGDWAPVAGAASPYLAPVTGGTCFYRLRLDGSLFDFRYLAPLFTVGIGDSGGSSSVTSPENPNSLTTGINAQDNGLGSMLLHTGELTQHVMDLSIPGRGFSWCFERSYRSGLQYDGPLGHGWDFNYNRRLVVETDGDVLRLDGLGRADRYVPASGGYISPGGYYTRLTHNPDGTFDERDRHGMVASYAGPNILGVARLTRLRDRNGNEMTFSYNPQGQMTNVSDTLGRPIVYSYDANGRLTQVTDFTGRTLRFVYDQNGDLTEAISPAVTGTPNGNDFPLGKTTRYTYSGGFGDPRFNHNLLTVTAPNETAASGAPRLVAQYDTNPGSANADRVLSLFLGGTNASGVMAGGMIVYAYTSLGNAPPNDFTTAVAQTTVSNRGGNTAEYRFNRLGNVVRQMQLTRGLRPGEPTGFTNQFEYNSDGEMTRLTNPEGDSLENTYDGANPDRFQQGNLLQVRRLPGPRGGDQPQLVSNMTYETNFNFVLTHTDPRGNTTTHSYDARGNRTRTVNRIPSAAEDFEYNTHGQMTARVWPDNGNDHRRRDVFSYHDSPLQLGYLRSVIVDSGGLELTTSFDYDAAGNVVRSVDPRGNDTLYTVNALNQVVREQSRPVATTGGPVRYQREWRYDSNNNMVRSDVENRDDNGLLDVTNPAFTDTFDYDILDDLLSITQEAGVGNSVVTAHAYDGNQNRTLTRFGEATAGRDPFSAVQTLYDERDLVFRVIRGPGSPDQSTAQNDYDGNTNPLRTAHGTEDAGGRITTHSYDGYDRRVTTTDPMGNVRTWHYDPNGNALSERVNGELTDVPGSAANVRLSEAAYIYDAMDRRVRADRSFFDTQTQLPIGDGFATTSWIYSDNSQVLSTTDDNNHTTTRHYDGANRLKDDTDAKGNTVGHTYDANGNTTMLAEVDKSDLGNPDVTVTSHYSYDALDRQTEFTDTLNQTSRVGYNSRHLPVRMVDARGNVTRRTFDGLGRPLSAERILTITGDGNGVVTGSITTSQTWDDSSRLASRTDGNGNTTSYSYDPLDRRIRTDLADTTSTSFVYDVHDNRTQLIDANGSIVTSSYDANDRLSNTNVVPGPGVLGTTSETYQYDGLGRLVLAQNNDSRVTRRHDSLSAVTRETQQVLPASPARTVKSTRDGVGNLTGLTYPGGSAIAITYNALNLPSLVRDDPPGLTPFIATWQYVGRLAEQRKCGNNTVRNLQYDPLRRLTHIKDTNELTSLVFGDRMFGRDPVGNRMLDSSLVGPVLPDDRSYAYDSADRLISSHRMTLLPPPPTVYQLDNAGNRTSVSGVIDPGPYTLSPALPEPADYQVNQYTTTPFDSRTYDRNGNLSATDTATFTYNYRNQLVKFVASATGATTTYKYDCFDRRLEKNSAGTVTRHYYHGATEIEEQTAANATVATYVWNNGGDELLRMTRSGQNYYYHADDLGSPRKMTDASGTMVEQYDYGDYGKPAFSDGSGNPLVATAIGNPFLFQARYFDSESGFFLCSGFHQETRSGRSANRSDNDEIPIEIVALSLLPANRGRIYNPLIAEYFRNRKVPDLPSRPVHPQIAEYFRNRKVLDLPPRLFSSTLPVTPWFSFARNMPHLILGSVDLSPGDFGGIVRSLRSMCTCTVVGGKIIISSTCPRHGDADEGIKSGSGNSSGNSSSSGGSNGSGDSGNSGTSDNSNGSNGSGGSGKGGTQCTCTVTPEGIIYNSTCPVPGHGN